MCPLLSVLRRPFRLKLVLSLFLAGVVSPQVARAETPAAAADPVVMTINEEPVSAREYKLVMERQVAGVYGLFKERHNLEDHAGYWSEASGPEGPLARLRQVVREELVRIKVHQGIARQRGLVEKTAYADFQRDYLAENARRQEAHARGQVIYGPPQYRETAYYYIKLGDLIYKVQQAVAAELEPGITEAAIAAFHENNKDSALLEDERRRIRAYLALQEARQHLQARCASARVEADAAALRPLVPRVDVAIAD
ncbi:MAG: hypothetical protein K0R17_2372 [Rariglobus sp.]|jgi:hypothetical protein|nr:hypothetical protein [Rariglobus sp.]